MYAGISKGGSLVAIYEWRFVIPIDRKGNPLASGSDVMSVEGLLKQVRFTKILFHAIFCKLIVLMMENQVVILHGLLAPES